MGRYVIDMESDGLLDEVTKLHVLGWYNLETGESGVITDYDEMRGFLLQDDLTLICHNLIRFDIPEFELILQIKINARLIDTLALSWYLYPKRPTHGLAGFGEDYGIKKPEVEDWVGEPLHVYVNRVQEDVKINVRLFVNQLELLKELYDQDMEAVSRCIKYLCYKLECAKEQEDLRWKLDRYKTHNNLIRFELEYERKREILANHMPENILYKILSKPKVMYKKDKSLSKRGENWLSLLADLELDEDYDEPLKLEKGKEIGNPTSHKQLKEWLFELGWNPITFKYDKDSVTGKIRQIPQVSLPRGEGLCPSVKILYEVEPLLEELDMLYVIKHRIGLLKGFMRDVNSEGYIQAKIAGLANTLRFKHSVVVNLPKPTDKGDWRDGEHIRGCLIAPEGYVLCGSDMSSLEDRTKQHYMYYFDPEYVKSMIKPGFDPHLDLAEFGYKMTNGAMGIMPSEIRWFKAWDKDAQHSKIEKDRHTHLKKERHLFKTTNYGAVYGVGALKMSLTTGMPKDQCVILLKAYWEKNWAVKEIEKACIVKRIGNQMWLFNPVSKFWYSLRNMKDRFSTLNQGTGVYCFDRWVKKSRDKGIKMCGQFHDEIVTPIEKGREKEIESKLKDAIREVNEELKLNRALDIDVQFGNSYAEIH